ncbi:zinc ribbon domain-containing protein [Oceanobacillus halotolerans]|uniref:zinc ribbon domain-containing protein n=1 Tax=Oceanobacillus halotolerans TaxID=2663380 RepID=UPI0013DBAE7C|nr:zinc ribbon domain-containing protein [Oceanobacillus halotolerans]
MKFCHQCGNQLKDTAKFCNQCGTKVKEKSNPNNESDESNDINQVESSKDNDGSLDNTDDSVEQPEEISEETSNPEQLAYSGEHEIPTETSDSSTADTTPPQREISGIPPDPESQESEQAEEPGGLAPQQSVATEQSDQATSRQDLKKTKGSKAKKVLLMTLIPLLILAGIGYGGYTYLSSITAPEAFLDEFETAVQEEDVATLRNMLEPSVDSLILEDAHMEELVSYYQASPEAFQNILDNLETQAETGERDPEALLQLVTDGKQYVLFDAFHLEMQPVEISVSANFDGTAIAIDGSSIGSVESGQTLISDPLLPGSHVVTANYDGEYGQYEQEVTVNTFDLELEDNVAAVDIAFDGNYVTLTATDPEAYLYLNGINTGQQFKDISEYGPIKTDGTMTLQAITEYPWGDVQSEPVQLTDTEQEEIHFELDLVNERLEDQVMDAVNNHVREYIDAYLNLDTSYFTYMKNEDYLANMEDNFEQMTEDGWGFRGDAVSAEYDLGSLKVQEDDGGYVANILVDLTFDSAFYEMDEDPADYPKEMTNYIWDYELTYDETEEKWFITNNVEVDSFETDNLFLYEFN